MKKFIVFILIFFGILVEGADYNSMQDMILDSKNAIGKTITYKGTYTSLRVSYDWNRQRRPSMTVSSLEDSWQYLAIFFDKKFTERIKKLQKRQLINVTCKIKSFSIINTCELIDFTLIEY